MLPLLYISAYTQESTHQPGKSKGYQFQDHFDKGGLCKLCQQPSRACGIFIAAQPHTGAAPHLSHSLVRSAGHGGRVGVGTYLGKEYCMTRCGWWSLEIRIYL